VENGIYIQMSFLGNADHDYYFKVLLLGDSGAGKSTLLSRFTKDSFDITDPVPTTVGIEYVTKNLKVDGKNIKVEFWDTAGQERYRAVTSGYYKHSVGALIVYDITDRRSFENIPAWLSEVQQQLSEGVVLLLVGNKSDLSAQRRAVPVAEAAEFAENWNIAFTETSAMDFSSVESAFQRLVIEVYRKVSTAGSNDYYDDQDGEFDDDETIALNRTSHYEAGCCY
jgi:Ras-related protein Rab-11A